MIAHYKRFTTFYKKNFIALLLANLLLPFLTIKLLHFTLFCSIFYAFFKALKNKHEQAFVKFLTQEGSSYFAYILSLFSILILPLLPTFAVLLFRGSIELLAFEFVALLILLAKLR